MNRLPVLIALVGLLLAAPTAPAVAQDSSAIDQIVKDLDRLKPGDIDLLVWGSVFFIDNEYFGDRMSGYTLPGFMLKPHVMWRIHPDITLRGGAHWLHYWGANSYPAYGAYGAYPQYDSTSRPLHILPWLQATIRFSPRWTLTLGCLDNDGHDLPLPLYNPELTLVGDPEAGFELESGNNWYNLDLWADWREFIWDRSPVPERFTAGLSGDLHLYYDDWSFYLPLHFLVQHEGGQNMSVSHNIQNNFNAATGLRVNRPLWRDKLFFDLSCRLMWYHQHGNDAVPFSRGWGLFPQLRMAYDNRWLVNVNYWHGKDFVPLMGSWHFSSLSANTPELTFDRTRVLTLNVGYYHTFYHKIKSVANLYFYGTIYHYLPSTGTFTDGTVHEYGHRNQLAFGVMLHFNPNLPLR